MTIDKEGRSNFAVNGNNDSRIEIGEMKNSISSQFEVLKLSE